MSFRTMARVLERSTRGGTELLMLLVIASFADDDGDNAYPSVATLASMCRTSKRNANLSLAKLRKSGELEVSLGTGPHGTNVYRIVLRTAPLKCASPLKPASPPEASFTPEAPFTLKPASFPPEAGFPKPLKPASANPVLNLQEPRESARAARGTRLPPDWTLPAEWRAWCAAERPDLDPDETANVFRDHWIALSGQKGVKANWQATWRNWCRREKAGSKRHRTVPAASTGKDYSKGVTDGRLV